MAFVNLPPNLRDMFRALSDRISKLETGPNSAAYDASTALSTANTALANAATAYTAAQASLQPSASTIVNASNQMTAINASGIEVRTGTSNPRVVLNGNGLAGFNASGGTTFAILSSDGSAHFAGAITGSTITGSTLNINGNFIVDGTGLMTSTGATVTGTITTSNITATGGTIGGWNITSTLLYAGSSLATATATLSAATGNASFGTLTCTQLGVNTTATLSGATTISSTLYYTGAGTTTSTANVYINSANGTMARSTSSQRYKVAIEEQTIPKEAILALTPKSYVDKGEADAQGTTDGLPRLLGVIAEDLALIPVIKDLLVQYNEKGQPDAVNYDRIAVALIPLLKDHEARLSQLEGK
jgi:hypothetical protein